MGDTARLVVVTGGGAVGGYSMLVFTGWDHGLQGDRATKLKQNNLRHRLQVCALEKSMKLSSSILYENTVSYCTWGNKIIKVTVHPRIKMS